MKRKDFLKIASISTVGASLPVRLLGKTFSLEELQSGSHFDVIIIGSGYGASVSALRLAEAGIKCLMLEMGLDWDKAPNKFSNHAIPTKESTWLKNTTNFPFFNWVVFEKFTGVLDLMKYDNELSVYQGRGVGGGSLVNGGMCITPLRNEFENLFPNLNADLFYDKYYPLAHQELKGTETSDELLESEYFNFTRVFKKEATKAGFNYIKLKTNYDKEYLRKELKGEVPGSVTELELFYGNNHGKQDLRKTYLKKALDTGLVSILALHKVEQIIEEENGQFELVVTQINTKGDHIATKYYKTSKLFMGAGAIGTNEILLRSKHRGTLKNLNSQVGQKWGNNGNINSVRGFIPDEIGKQQATLPTYAIDAWDDTDQAFLAELGPFPLRIDARTMAYILINRVKKLANMYYNPAKDRLEINWDKSNWDHMIANTRRLLDTLAEVNGGGGSITGHDIEKQVWHSLGGCIIGEATDNYGRLRGYENIYITDSSLIPGQLGVNPFVTITALAEYCLEHIIREDFNQTIAPVTEKQINLVATPNPFKDFIHVNFYAPEATGATLQIINWAGRIVAQTKIQANEGQNSYQWSGLSFLWRQPYTLRIVIDRQIATTRIVRASWW